MASIRALKDSANEVVYPQTLINAVFDLDNQSLEKVLAEKADLKEVEDKFANFSSLDIQVVNDLPTEGSPTSIYLKKTSETEGNLYEEYLYVNNKWEMIGAKEIELALVATSGDFNDLNNKPSITTQNTITNFWIGTQEEYAAITTKDATTLYMITG